MVDEADADDLDGLSDVRPIVTRTLMSDADARRRLAEAFGADEVRDAISVAHDRAVESVLDHLSTEACYARRGAGGSRLSEANGFIAAAFRHRTSRAGDPQLHTHVVVPNAKASASSAAIPGSLRRRSSR